MWWLLLPVMYTYYVLYTCKFAGESVVYSLQCSLSLDLVVDTLAALTCLQTDSSSSLRVAVVPSLALECRNCINILDGNWISASFFFFRRSYEVQTYVFKL